MKRNKNINFCILFSKVKRQHDYKDKRVGGCIEALTGFLHSFNSILDQNCRDKIHGYLLMLITRFLLVDKRVHTKTGAYSYSIVIIYLFIFLSYLYLVFLNFA